MLVRILKLSANGRLALPPEALRALRVRTGDEFVLLQGKDQVVLIPARKAGKRLLDSIGGWTELSAAAFAKAWGTDEDHVWDEV